MDELKPVQKIIKKVEKALKKYDGVPYNFCAHDKQFLRLVSAYRYYQAQIKEIRARAPPPKWEFYHHHAANDQRSMQRMICKAIAVDEHNKVLDALAAAGNPYTAGDPVPKGVEHILFPDLSRIDSSPFSQIISANPSVLASIFASQHKENTNSNFRHASFDMSKVFMVE